MLLAILAPRWLYSETKNSLGAVEGNPLEARLFIGLMAMGLVVLAGRRRDVLPLLRMNGAIVLFLLYCAVSTLWSDYPGVAFKRWLKALGDFVMVMIILTDPQRSVAVKRFLTRSGFLLVPVSVLLIRFTNLGAQYKFQDGRQVFVGVTNDKNLLGVICLVFGLGAVWRVLHAFRERRHAGSNGPLVAHAVMLAMTLWLFVKANSATSFACFVLASVVLVATSLPALARNRAVVHLLVAAVVAVAALALFLNVGSSLVTTLGRDQTLTGRKGLWNEVLGMTASPWFGTGFESFWTGSRLDQIWRRHWSHPNEAHNGYLEVFLNLGWVGVTLLAVVIVNAYRSATEILRRNSEAGSLRLAYFVVGVIYSFTEAGFRLLNPVWISFILAVIAVPETPTVVETSSARSSRADARVAVLRNPKRPTFVAPLRWRPASAPLNRPSVKRTAPHFG